MNIPQSLKMGVVATVLWLSASGSGLAATSFVADQNQSNAPEIPTNLISQVDMRRFASQSAGFRNISKFDEIWTSRTDAQKRMFEHCNTQKEVPVDDCFSGLQMWAMDQMMRGFDSGNYRSEDPPLLTSIVRAVSER